MSHGLPSEMPSVGQCGHWASFYVEFFQLRIVTNHFGATGWYSEGAGYMHM